MRKDGTRPNEGRATKYRPEYCQMMIDFFDVEPTETVIKKITTKNGTVIEEPVQRAVRFPSIERFAFKIGVIHETLLEWTKRFPEFAETYSRAKELQKYILNTNALSGLYDSRYAQFVAINCTDMRQKQELALDAAQGTTLNIEIRSKSGKEISQTAEKQGESGKA